MTTAKDYARYAPSLQEDAMLQTRHYLVIADAMAGGYQFGVEPYQRPEAYSTRRHAWRQTVGALAANLKTNNKNFDLEAFQTRIAEITGHTVRHLFVE